MSGKTPISKARTYQEIGAFWDEHDATEFGEQTGVEFDEYQIPIQIFPIRQPSFIKDKTNS